MLVEKPATCSHLETERLLAAAQAADRNLTVAWGYFLDPVARDLRNLIQSGAIGDIVHMNSHFGYNLTGPFGSSVLSDSDHWVRELPAKLIHNVADHIFNKIVELLPNEESVVEAHTWPADVELSCDGIPTEMRALHKEWPDYRYCHLLVSSAPGATPI